MRPLRWQSRRARLERKSFSDGADRPVPLALIVRGAGFQFGSVAQWLEQTTHNRSVAGSNPATPTISD
jgi:hypothetical protein